jgi:hypothetical protein
MGFERMLQVLEEADLIVTIATALVLEEADLVVMTVMELVLERI